MFSGSIEVETLVEDGLIFDQNKTDSQGISHVQTIVLFH